MDKYVFLTLVIWCIVYIFLTVYFGNAFIDIALLSIAAMLIILIIVNNDDDNNKFGMV